MDAERFARRLPPLLGPACPHVGVRIAPRRDTRRPFRGIGSRAVVDGDHSACVPSGAAARYVPSRYEAMMSGKARVSIGLATYPVQPARKNISRSPGIAY